MNRNRLLMLAAVLWTCVISAEARVISYAPYTDRTAYPAHQSRTNRYFALVEAAPQIFGVALPAATYGQLVIYDSQGAEEPRVVFPQDGSYATFTAVAVRESDSGTPVIYV